MLVADADDVEIDRALAAAVSMLSPRSDDDDTILRLLRREEYDFTCIMIILLIVFAGGWRLLTAHYCTKVAGKTLNEH